MFWKISVHLLAQGGVFGTILALNALHKSDIQVFLMASALAAGLTAYSRVRLDAHTHGQTYAGFCLGAVMNYIIISEKLMF
jgi:membrane-associated phospholipid phosphatase